MHRLGNGLCGYGSGLVRLPPVCVHFQPMRRSLTLLFLLTSLFWQSLTLAGQATALGQAQDLGHALLHWQDSAHHHHEDGSFHEEDSPDAAQHVVADGALQTPGLISGAIAHVLNARTPTPAAVDERAAAPPLIDGPRRPPRAYA